MPFRPRTTALVALTAAGVVALAGCSSSSSSGSGASGASGSPSVTVSAYGGQQPANATQLQQVVDSYAAAHYLPGSVVGVWRPGQPDAVITQGYSNVANKTPMKSDDTFIIASTTKSFVGTVALQLIGEGKLSLDSKLSEFQPNFPNAANITVEQLLNMTSGIYDYSTDPKVIAQLAENPEKVWPHEELVNIAAANPPYFAPGQGWHYTNTNTVLIGLIIEKVTGNKLEQEIASRITTPLGLKNTFLPATTAENKTTATGYNLDQDNGTFLASPNVDPSFLWAAGAMISNLNDLKVWAKALGTGQMITPQLQAQRTQFQPITLAGTPPFYTAMDPAYGLAMERYQLPPNEFIGHSGKTSNFNTQMYYQPSTGSILITLINTDTVAGYGPLFFATVAQAAIPGSFPGVTDPQASASAAAGSSPAAGASGAAASASPAASGSASASGSGAPASPTATGAPSASSGSATAPASPSATGSAS